MHDMRLVQESRYFLCDSVHHASVHDVTHVCACVLDVMEKGLGSVPVSMNSPQSNVNTAALFSSQPSAGSPQACAGDHTPRPHTHIHACTHTCTAQNSLQIRPHARIHTDHTTPARAPRTQTSLSCRFAQRVCVWASRQACVCLFTCII
ncbi:hypothetical protein ILYODFUR_002846 [Ilyodon furcidens]|uniref:Uncharacterized protein n=1 Tax=Ilyodon furcidens TaxID=33524 RepID=A0ABV0T842_9TELE